MDSNGSVQNDQGTGLQVRDLKVFYGPVPAVRGVSLDCPPGRVVGVIGATGAGKTSLLSGIAGLVKTQGGKVELDGRDITGWPAHRRGQAGIVYVAERRRVFPSLSVRENLTVGGWGLDKGEVNIRVEKIFTMFPRLKEREKVPSFRLSGGEQRMVSIGRALVTGARVILFDELSLGLAPRIVAELVGTVRSLADEGRIIVLVEQYIGVLLKTADTIDVLERGRVKFTGPTNDAAAWLEENGDMAHAKTAGQRAGAPSRTPGRWRRSTTRGMRARSSSAPRASTRRTRPARTPTTRCRSAAAAPTSTTTGPSPTPPRTPSRARRWPTPGRW